MLHYSREVNMALRFMLKAHEGQVDKQGLPYFIHPLVVASDMDDSLSTVVALLHDVLEDTDYTEKDLKAAGFSPEAIEALKLLKHEKGVPYLEYIDKLRDNELAKKVKIADLRHNRNLYRFDGDIPQNVLDKIRDCYDPALDMLNEQKYLAPNRLAQYNASNSEKEIGAGSATFLIRDDDFLNWEKADFVRWLIKQGYKCSTIAKRYMPQRVLYVNMNSKTYSFGMPGIRVTANICDHAITIDEFMQIYNIYKKYEGLPPLKMSEEE